MTLQINLNLLADNNGVAGEALTQDRIAVNDSFFVEIEVADVRDNSAGVIGLALDIEWDAAILEASETEITDQLPFNPQGTIDNETGLIAALGAGAIPNFDLGEAVGIDTLERFALIRFQGELASDAPIPLTVTVSDPRNVAFADGTPFDSDGVEIEAQTIEVVQGNNPPTLVNDIADVTAIEDQELSFTVPDDTFQDIDEGDRLRYSASLNSEGNLPSWLSFDPDNKTFSGTPENSDVGSLYLKVRVTDNDGATASNSFFLNVENTNDLPILANEISDTTAVEDKEFSFTIPDDTFRDIDQGDRLTYSAILNDGEKLPKWLTFDAETKTFSGTPDNSDVGVLELKVRATDNAGKTTSDRFFLTVENVDDPPVVSNQIADVEVDEDSENSLIDISDTFRDADGEDSEIVKTVVANSNEDLVTATIRANDLTLDYQENRSGKAEITIQAESNGETVTDIFEVTVNSVDDLPVVSNPLDDVEVNENAAAQIIDLSNVFRDLDGDEIALDVRTNGNDLVTPTLDGTDLTLDFLKDRFGSAEITIEATANSQVISDTFTVRVNEVVPPSPTNTPPILANEIADVRATEDSEFNLTIDSDTFIDPDEGDRLTYSAILNGGGELPNWLTFDADTKTFSGTPDNSDVGTLNLKVNVTDKEGEIASDRFFLTVENVDDPPVVSNPIADVVVDEDSENTVIDLTDLFSDVDNENSEIALTLAGNSNESLVTASIEANQITLDYLPDRFGTSEITVRGESNSKTIEDTFTVNVNSVNDPPIVENPLTDDTATSGEYFELTIAEDSFSDHDLEDSLIYSATTGDGSDLPAWLSFATDTQTFSGTPGNTDAGDLKIAVRATDSSGAMVSDSFTLTVASPSADDTDSIVYRFFNTSTGVHFYTIDEVEKDYVLNNLSNYILEEGTYAAVDPLTGEEVYRFFNNQTGAHLYTTDKVEKDYIIENLGNFDYEGIKFYASETQVDNSVPVYRFYEPSKGVHFYTSNEVEKTFVEDNLANYIPEGVAYYAFPIL